MLENLKAMPYGDVWNHYCEIMSVPDDKTWIDIVFKYEEEVLSKRV
jgi:L-rhamnose isomerase